MGFHIQGKNDAAKTACLNEQQRLKHTISELNEALRDSHRFNDGATRDLRAKGRLVRKLLERQIKQKKTFGS